MKSHSISVGDRFGKWTVVGPFYRMKLGEGRGANYPLYYPCRCDCGTERGVRAFKLLGNSTSCGCDTSRLRSERVRTHGQSGGRTNKGRSRLYRIWSGMQQRCCNENHANFEIYGASGILICDEWRDSFVAFREWSMANSYADNLTIDRIDGKEGYRPDNCRWVTQATQTRNQRTNRIFTAAGETKCAEDWALDPRCSVTPTTIKRRMEKMGWSAEEAIFTPRMMHKSAPRYLGTNAYRKVTPGD